MPGDHDGAETRKGPLRSEWKRHKRTIVSLYERYPLKEVRREMERKHSFFATKRMYDIRFRKWGIGKNLKGAEKDQMLMELAKDNSQQPPLKTALDHISRKDIEKAIRHAKARDRRERMENSGNATRTGTSSSPLDEQSMKAEHSGSDEQADASPQASQPEGTSSETLAGKYVATITPSESSRSSNLSSSSNSSSLIASSPEKSTPSTTDEAAIVLSPLHHSRITPPLQRQQEHMLFLIKSYYSSRLDDLTPGERANDILTIGTSKESHAYWSNVKNGNYLWKIALPGTDFKDDQSHGYQALAAAGALAKEALRTEPLDFMLEIFSTLSSANISAHPLLRAHVLRWLLTQATSLFPPSHPIVLLCATLLSDEDDCFMSRSALFALLDLFSARLGCSHRSTYRVMSTIITHMRRSGDESEVVAARSFAKNAFQLATLDHGPESDEARRAAVELAHVLTKLGEYGSTLRLRMDVVSIQSSRRRGNDPVWRQDRIAAHTMEDIAEYYVRFGDVRQGIEWLQRAKSAGLVAFGAESISWMHIVDKLEKLERGKLKGQVADGRMLVAV